MRVHCSSFRSWARASTIITSAAISDTVETTADAYCLLLMGLGVKVTAEVEAERSVPFNDHVFVGKVLKKVSSVPIEHHETGNASIAVALKRNSSIGLGTWNFARLEYQMAVTRSRRNCPALQYQTARLAKAPACLETQRLLHASADFNISHQSVLPLNSVPRRNFHVPHLCDSLGTM